MTIKNIITGINSDGKTMAVDNYGGQAGPSGSVVYTEQRQIPLITYKPFFNPSYGFAMNQDGAFGGTPDKIHNGIDDILWTGSVEGGPAGRFDFNSSDQQHTGSFSIDATVSANGNSAVLTRATTIDTDNYKAITGWIYITSWSIDPDDKDVEFQLRNAGVSASGTVGIRGKLLVENLNVWQKFTIPISDLGITNTTIDELVFTTISPSGSHPDYYIDDLQFEQTGEAIEFRIEPSKNTIFEVSQYSLFLVDIYDSTLLNSSMPKIPYDTLLGASLSSGLASTVQINGAISSGGIFSGLGDFMSFIGETSMQSGYDGTNTWIKLNIKLPGVFRLDSRKNDFANLVLTDDLTGLVRMEFVAIGNQYIIGN